MPFQAGPGRHSGLHTLGGSHGKAILETGQYAVSGSGSAGELSAAGGKTEYYYSGMGRYRMLFSRHGIHLGQEREVVL